MGSFGSFDGVTTMVLKVRKHRWQGPTMRALMRAMPAICNKSAVNRGIARDEGVVDQIVELLLSISKRVRPGDDDDEPDLDVVLSKDTREDEGEDLGAPTEGVAKADSGDGACLSEETGEAVMACVALEALCRANDGNKKTAARLQEEFNEEELLDKGMDDLSVPMFKSKEGALEALMTILERSYENGAPNNTKLQVSAFRALRSLTTDDDMRQMSCAPSSVQNREFCSDEENFPTMRKILSAAMAEPSPAMAQTVLLLMKDVLAPESHTRACLRGWHSSEGSGDNGEGWACRRACREGSLDCPAPVLLLRRHEKDNCVRR